MNASETIRVTLLDFGCSQGHILILNFLFRMVLTSQISDHKIAPLHNAEDDKNGNASVSLAGDCLSTKKSPNSQISEDKLGYAMLEFVLQVTITNNGDI